MKAILYSATAGLCAAAASAFAKLAFSDMTEKDAKEICLPVAPSSVCNAIQQHVIWVARAAALACMLASNGLMMTMFTRAMHLSSSLIATVATTSCNFTFAAILSLALFGEELSPLWVAGFGCILVGLAMLAVGQRPEHAKGD
jgi:drug/metabolite transporter (DMT)-like permease